MITKDIKIIEGFCVHCGMCAEICPKDAISLRSDQYGQLYPVIDYAKCNMCKLCYNTCPVEALNTNNFRKDYSKNIHSALGDYKQCFLSYSKAEKTRYESSSAGVIKSVLFNGLKEGQFPTIVAVAEDNSSPLRPYFKIIQNFKECSSITNSKYCPVAFNGAIKKLINDKSLNYIVFVGLPCHIKAIKKVCKYIPSMKKKKIVTIGLFCKKTKDIRYTKYLKDRLLDRDILKNEIQHIQFRGCGWPGKIRFIIRNKKYETQFDAPSVCSFPWRWSLFSPHSCLFCYDAFAREADISIGDPWLEKYLHNDKYAKGVSFVVVRSEKGEALFNDFKNILVSKKVNSMEIIESQSPEAIMSKILNAKARVKLLSFFSKKFVDVIDDERLTISETINAIWFLFFKCLFEFIFQFNFFARLNNFIFKVLTHLPLRIIK